MTLCEVINKQDNARLRIKLRRDRQSGKLPPHLPSPSGRRHKIVISLFFLPLEGGGLEVGVNSSRNQPIEPSKT